MPLENLTSDAGLDWASRGAAAAVVYDLAGAKRIFAQQVMSLSDAQSVRASRLVEGYFVTRNGRLWMRASVEDLSKTTKTLESWEIDGDAAAGYLPLVNELARKLSSDARVFGTSNENAFRFFGGAMGAKDTTGAEQALQQATQVDSGFAAAYLEEAKLLAETGNRERARQVMAAAEGARLDAIERANLELQRAAASGDTSGRLKALESLAAATPADANVVGQIADLRFGRREFQRAALEYRAAAQLDPDEVQIWNELGYALAWSGDLKGAREALSQYEQLAPEDNNALDSQGEVSYMLGDFKAADEYFEKAAARNPGEFLKAAEARLMAGDPAGADALFAKHLGRGQSTGAEYQIAQWEFLTGRRKAAMARLEKLTRGLSGDLQALALSQLAVWEVQVGNRDGAADLARRAVAAAQTPPIQRVSRAMQFIADPGGGGSESKMTEAIALLLRKDYGEALPILQAVYYETNPAADGQVRMLLAWAYLETGAIDRAAGLVSRYPLPMSSGDPLFASLVFPRCLMVRGAVLEHQGKGEDAKRLRALYLRYEGATN